MSNTSTSVFTKKLTYQELKEKREKGLCFNYDKKYTKGHNCRNQKLYRLEITEEKEVSDDQGFNEVEYQEEPETLSLTLNTPMGTMGITSKD